jgi:nucleotide-binding universal stress UspA family protein
MTSRRYSRIAVAIDGSEIGHEALATAIDLAHEYGAALDILSVAPIGPVYATSNAPYIPPDFPESNLAYYRGVVDAAVAEARTAGVAAVTGLVEEGVVVDEILTVLDQHPPDLLVVGSRGLSTAKRILLGSVSTALVTQAPCPVLVVRAVPTRRAA